MFRGLRPMHAARQMLFASVVLAGVLSMTSYQGAFAMDSRCSHYAQTPYMSSNSLKGYGEASCSVYENREAGSQLKEDLAWGQPDPTLAESSWEAVGDFHSRTASRTMVWRQDGDTQEYYTRFWTYDSVYGRDQVDSGQLATHWAWR